MKKNGIEWNEMELEKDGVIDSNVWDKVGENERKWEVMTGNRNERYLSLMNKKERK